MAAWLILLYLVAAARPCLRGSRSDWQITLMNLKDQQETASYSANDLRVDYAEGNVAHLDAPYTSGWRRMPLHVVGQVIKGKARLDFDDGQHVVIHAGE